MKKVYKFIKRCAKGYLKLSEENWALRCTGNVWINPDF